ncbi:hypothetical protein QM565_08580 [Geitlerinema splendidum]|nr:hypothetical protein [Geitlerinema splendidum]
MGRWEDGEKKGIGSWELGVGEEGWGEEGKSAIVPDTYLEHRYLVCKLQHFRLSTLHTHQAKLAQQHFALSPLFPPSPHPLPPRPLFS